MFVLQNSFAPSGLNGIATMIQYLFQFKIGYLNLIINIPLIILSFFVLDRAFSLRSGAYTIVFSIAILLFEKIDLTDIVYKTANGTSTVLAPIAAGVVGGFVYGTVIKKRGCTGGTDIVAALIRKKRPYLNLMWTIFGINTLVAVISYFVYGFKIEPVLLCIIYSFVIGRVGNNILRGVKEAVKFEVITENAEALSARLIERLHHGVTTVPAIGMYSHKSKNMLVCVVNKHQIIDFQNVLKEFPDTFAYISTVHETVGNFKTIHHP
jgi:uncharacterized membrane-anchored protein YitT (DUF2179 family)